MNDSFEEWWKNEFETQIKTKTTSGQNYISKKSLKNGMRLSWFKCKKEILDYIKKDGHRMVNSYTIIEEIEENT